jgi:polysaccharide biosynthesis/export protein
VLTNFKKGASLNLILRASLVGVGLLTLTGCNAPRGAALQGQIVAESKAKGANFDFLAVTQENVLAFNAWPGSGKGVGVNWPSKGQSQRSRAIRADDLINLTIWDSQENSLLSTGPQHASPINNITVAPDGTIFVPYIDRVKVAGLSPEMARADIQQRLEPLAPSAQVELSVVQGSQNIISLISGVATPGNYPIAAGGVSILNLLAAGGGIRQGLSNPLVRLQRGDSSYAVWADDLYRNPSLDILMRGGDQVVVEADPRFFLSLGATGQEKMVPFSKASHTLLEALSLSNGLSEGRSNLKGVLVLREYGQKSLRQDGKGPVHRQVVFAFDLSKAQGLFAARKFQINSEDVVLATESPIPSAGSVLGLFGNVLGIATRVENF